MNPEVEHALELAKKRYGPNLQGAIPQSKEMARKFGKVHPRVAFAAGKRAKHLGFFRTSPYYELPGADHFWFAGYDGKTTEEAIATQ